MADLESDVARHYTTGAVTDRILAALDAEFSTLPQPKRIGITGPPGAGKSTLTSLLVGCWRRAGARVGVIAVDPSSPFSGGALLGDRLRMLEHVNDPEVFVRSMASRGIFGGLAAGCDDACDVLALAGFDPLIVETVGVGQSEVDVAALADMIRKALALDAVARERLAAEARAHVKANFDKARMCAATLEVYREILHAAEDAPEGAERRHPAPGGAPAGP